MLAQGSPDDPRGVTVDVARAIAGRLGLPVSFVCFGAAEVSFTAPYVLIEGVYAVPTDSLVGPLSDVDRDGVRIGVKEG